MALEVAPFVKYALSGRTAPVKASTA